MSWIMFFLGLMVGSTVGVCAMCVVFYAREPAIPLELPDSYTPTPH
jgi:hypothetical protein